MWLIENMVFNRIGYTGYRYLLKILKFGNFNEFVLNKKIRISKTGWSPCIIIISSLINNS